ncbi:MAG: DUF1700 domain-containing protein [Prevotella sp.]|nr:DUF1700 domain-containing protein [Prevotella sp.]
MTRKQYISKLRKSLMFRLPNSEIDEIVSDMEECFEAGAAEGKSEEEIAVSLGEPKAAAASLLSEQRGGERVSKLAEMWLPLIISVILYGVYMFCGYHSAENSYRNYVIPFVCVLPMIMWLLFERKGFFTALAEYKCDFFTLFGVLSMTAACGAFDKIPEASILLKYPNSDVRKCVVIMAVFVCIAMVLLAVSLWKNAPKFFAVIPAAGIIATVYQSVRLCTAYNLWDGDKNNIGGANIGETLSNIYGIIFICGTVFLIWSFIHRNALSLASAYCAMTVTGFMFYWYYNLAAMDPTDGNSAVFLRAATGRNYLIWGTVIAAAVLVMTFIVKLAGGKRGG